MKEVYLLYGPNHGTRRAITSANALDITEDLPTTNIAGPDGDIIVTGYLTHRYEFLKWMHDPGNENDRIRCFIYKGCRLNPIPNNQIFIKNEMV